MQTKTHMYINCFRNETYKPLQKTPICESVPSAMVVEKTSLKKRKSDSSSSPCDRSMLLHPE